MPKTLLAVDDSATMRKVLEITFSGEDFRVITADAHASALAKMSEGPSVVVIDTALGDGGDAYALAKEIRGRDAKATIVMLSSRNNAYDAAKGRDAGADDFMDKPFDTQQMIDRVRKAIVAREAGAGASPASAKPVSSATAPSMQSPFAQQPVAAKPQPAVPITTAPVVPAATAAAAKPSFASGTSRTHTLSFEQTPLPRPAAPVIVQPPAHTATTPSMPQARPQPTPAAAAVQPAAQAAAPAAAPARTAPSGSLPQTPGPTAAQPSGVAAAVNGHLAGKLSQLGLTAAQADAVLALSREVVERVVWEVVPQLAETMIKEEIARLMKDAG